MGDRGWPVVVAGLAVAALLVAAVPDDQPWEPPAEAPPADAAEPFLAAYERSRTATFVVDQRITRTVDGRELSVAGRLVQRPPDDRVVVGLGGANGRIDGRVVRCPAQPDGTRTCTTGPEASSYAAEVDAELATLRTLVTGIYAVTTDDDGCFVLRLRPGRDPDLTYGDRATLCFDEATGAPSKVEVEVGAATTTVEATDIRPTVTDADLRLD